MNTKTKVSAGALFIIIAMCLSFVTGGTIGAYRSDGVFYGVMVGVPAVAFLISGILLLWPKLFVQNS
ncbi:MAG: hypothetical protein NWE92_01200 [Candidatus Bathyarchaeota archaeon]|nr:hypothetical protein [Candidatus Bathyarchaeota archaeon]